MTRLFTSALLASTLSAAANLDPEPESRSPMTAMPGRFGVIFGGASPENGGSDFSWEQLTLQGGFALNKEFSDEIKMFYGVNYRFTRINTGSFHSRADLGHLHDIIVPLSFSYDPSDSPWSFFAQISGQLATDFTSITSHDFDYFARVGARYQFSDTFSLNFGAARVRNFGEAIVLPALGCTWQPTDDWAFTLLGPRITLSYKINPTKSTIASSSAEEVFQRAASGMSRMIPGTPSTTVSPATTPGLGSILNYAGAFGSPLGPEPTLGTNSGPSKMATRFSKRISITDSSATSGLTSMNGSPVKIGKGRLRRTALFAHTIDNDSRATNKNPTLSKKNNAAPVPALIESNTYS